MDFAPGQKVYWLYTPRGGYGYTQRVIATVQRTTAKRVTIQVITVDRNGNHTGTALRNVTPDKLIPRQ